MIDESYAQAMTEVLDILDHTRIKDLNQISSKFIEFLKKYSSKTYTPNLDYTKKLNDMNLNPKTRALICLIYREYFCNKNQRNEYDRKIIKADLDYQKELQAKYNTNNLFKNKK